jgi:hypothetical protein
MEESRKILTPRLIVLLVILAIGGVVALYMQLVYVPIMREYWDDGPDYEELNLDGDGEVATPFLIRTPEDLAELAEKVSNGSSYHEKYFLLMNDIDMTEYLSPGGAGYNEGAGWLPIGEWHRGRNFGGVLDGAGHTISGLWLDRPDLTGAGLFGCLISAEIYSLNVEVVSITARSQIGAIAGHASNSIIINCTAKIERITTTCDFNFPSLGILVGTASGNTHIEQCSVSGTTVVNAYRSVRFGGITGFLTMSSVIRRCTSDIDVIITGENQIIAGGLAGRLHIDSVIDNSSSSGSVTIIAERNITAGGLAGGVQTGSQVRRSSSSSDVSGAFVSGGFVGELLGDSTITASFATGNVSCEGKEGIDCRHGGFVGESSGTISNSFYEGNFELSSDCVYVGGFVGVLWTGKISDCYTTAYITFRWFFDNFDYFIGWQDDEAVIINSYSTFNPPETFDDYDFINVWFMPEGGGYPTLRGVR